VAAAYNRWRRSEPQWSLGDVLGVTTSASTGPADVVTPSTARLCPLTLRCVYYLAAQPIWADDPEFWLSVVGSSVVFMSMASEHTTDAGQPAGRPVLGAALSARAAVSSSSPQRLWALSDAEVAESMVVLGQLAASVDAHLVAVLAEAKTRGLGVGEGWGRLTGRAPRRPDCRRKRCWTWTRSRGRRASQGWLRSSRRLPKAVVRSSPTPSRSARLRRS
jgi:hypothetical protein